MRRLSFLIAITLLSTTFSFAQLREIPQAVKDAFGAQYDSAASPEFIDKLAHVQVRFEQDGEKKLATYNNKGMWRETEQDWAFEKLSDDVKDGFAKSKYSSDEWEVAETKIITRPGGKELFRVKVQKNEVQKKYLFFNASGRLVNESITL